VPQFSTGNLTIEDAYRIQSLVLQLRVESGERIVGMKMGFTNRAKLAQKGLSSMICGRLTDAMIVEEGGSTPRARYVRPYVEPELAFVLRKPLRGRITLAEAIAAVEYVTAAIEIVDSRYRDFKFSVVDALADNASASGVVIGTARRPTFDIGNIGMLLSIDGQLRGIGSSAAILGNPWRSLVAAAALAERAGFDLPAGALVLAGSATDALEVGSGTHVMLETRAFAPVQFSFAAAL